MPDLPLHESAYAAPQAAYASGSNGPSASAEPAPGGSTRPVPLTDDDLAAMMRDHEPSFWERNSGRVVTLALIAANVIAYLAEVLLSGTGQEISLRTLVEMGAMCAPFVQGPEDLYRFITPMFLHMDLMHLLFNMVALYSVGELLERVLGRGSFVILYFVAGITGNAVSYATSLVEGGLSVSAGASTSVFGLFVAVALLCVLVRGDRAIFREFSRGMLSVIAINVVYTLLVPSVSISGHLGGAVGGAIAMLMIPAASLRTPRAVRIVVAVAWVAALAGVLVWGGVF